MLNNNKSNLMTKLFLTIIFSVSQLFSQTECDENVVEDCLGICGGDNVCLSIDNINGTNGSFDILYNSIQNIYGFQLTLEGLDNISCSNEHFSITNQGDLFLGFSFQGIFLEPSSNGTLLNCEFTPGLDLELCFDNVKYHHQ